MNPRIVLLQTTEIADSNQNLRKNDIKRSLIAEVWTDQDTEVAMFLITQVLRLATVWPEPGRRKHRPGFRVQSTTTTTKMSGLRSSIEGCLSVRK